MWYKDFSNDERSGRARQRKKDGRDSILAVEARLAGGGERMYRVGGLLLLTISLVGLLWVGMVGARRIGEYLFSQNSQFAIRKLELASTGKLTPEHIRDYGHLAEGMNLFTVDIQALRHDLESVPLVRAVDIRRQLPDTLKVSVTERIPVARLGAEEHGYNLAVDRQGFVLGPSSVSPQLPVITGLRDRGLRPGSQIADPLLTDALQTVDLSEQSRLSSHLRIKSIDVSRDDLLDVRLAQGERVLLSRDNIDAKLGKLNEILRRSAAAGKTVAAVDMTVDRNFPVQYR